MEKLTVEQKAVVGIASAQSAAHEERSNRNDLRNWRRAREERTDSEFSLRIYLLFKRGVTRTLGKMPPLSAQACSGREFCSAKSLKNWTPRCDTSIGCFCWLQF